MRRVSSQPLKPGDEIRVACGQTWNETLKPSASGTANSPISITPWPTPCATPPTIDGTVPVPSFLWSYVGAATWSAPVDINLVRNGGAENGSFGWTVWSPNRDAKLAAATTDCPVGTGPCIGVVSGTGSPSQVTIVSTFTFPMESARLYALSFALKAAEGATVRVLVRRAEAPWSTIGTAKAEIVGTGSWDSHFVPFRSPETLGNARVDIEVQSGRIPVAIDSVVVRPAMNEIRDLIVDGESMLRAHHPNRGYDQQQPASLYLPIASDADVRLRTVGTITKSGSSYLPIGPELQIPAGASLDGTKVSVRSTPWTLEERAVSSVTAGALLFDSDTDFPLRAGFGYFLTGARWMVDSPGEWVADNAARQLVARMPDSKYPGERVKAVHLPYGIDLGRLAYVNVDGLRVTNTVIGVNAANSINVALQNSVIENTVDEGIDVSGARNPLIRSNRVRRSGGDAIGLVVGGIPPTGAVIADNDVRESGVRIAADGRIISLPVPVVGAIRSGTDGTVSGNRVTATGYSGITPTKGGVVANNVIENACLVLDDCGGIYTFGPDLNISITGNIVRNLIGTNDGKPASEYNVPHAVGIYLDENSSLATVSGNTVFNAQHGIQLHNAFMNRVLGNTLYANRTYQLWLQEGSKVVRATGDIFGNQVYDNILVPTGNAIGVSQDTQFSGTNAFAVYDRNVHSALQGPTVAREKWTGAEYNYTFPGWQATKNADGTPRLLDSNGRVVAPTGYTSFEIAGANMIPNSTFAAGVDGWAEWNEIAPKGSLTLATCGSAPCVRVNPGGSSSLLSSPNFSIVEGQVYRFSVDILATVDNQKIALAPRRGGGGTNGYELVTDQKFNLFATTAWRRFAITFRATKTVNAADPVTGDAGARLDLQQIYTGQPIWVRNMELVPLRAVGTTLRTQILDNTSSSAVSVPCPDAVAFPVACGQYVRFETGAPVQWPATVQPYSSQVIYTRDSTLVDSDSDGIADVQDACSATPVGSPTNARGCALGQ